MLYIYKITLNNKKHHKIEYIYSKKPIKHYNTIKKTLENRGYKLYKYNAPLIELEKCIKLVKEN